jgi:photosystem II stability/assembly factor-like uncharacterized protein
MRLSFILIGISIYLFSSCNKSDNPNIPPSDVSNWSTIYSGVNNNLKSVYFYDINNGFAVGNSYPTGFPMILKSTNGGTDWKIDSSGITNISLSSVWMDNISSITAVGSNGTILKSTNSGTNWFSVPTNTSQSLNAIEENYISGTSGITLKYDGTTWNILQTGISNDLYTVFKNNYSGWIYSGGSSGLIIYSTDSGISWLPSNTTVSDNVKSIFFVNTVTGFACGQYGLFIKTTDGGVNWFRGILSADSTTFEDLHFKNEFIAIAVGENGTIYKTINGGNNWTKVISPTDNYLRSVYFINENTGLIVGESGTILLTTNGGM